MRELSEMVANGMLLNEIQGLIKRSAVLLYGVVTYAIGVTGLLWFILALGSLAPWRVNV